jgi:hypothetical protein
MQVQPDLGIDLALPLMLLTGVAALALFVLWLWALVHAIGNDRLDSTMKLVWVIVILFTGPLGPLLYLFVGRSQRSAGG